MANSCLYEKSQKKVKFEIIKDIP